MLTTEIESLAGNCQEPVLIGLFDSSRVLVRCRRCKKCQRDYITTWVGKCMLEARSAERTLALTLTYNERHRLNSQSLPKEDIQNLLKRLRADGHILRYLCVAEFGSKNGRGHWHCLLFVHCENKSKPLDLPPPETEQVDWKYWADDRRKSKGEFSPMGYVFVQTPDIAGVGYVLKYLRKDAAEQHHRRMLNSKRPPLGNDGLCDIQRVQVEKSLAFSHRYRLSDAQFSNGNAIEFTSNGRNLVDAWLSYRNFWQERHGRGVSAPIADHAKKAWLKAVLHPDVRSFLGKPFKRSAWIDVKSYFDRQLWIDGNAVVRLSRTGDWFHLRVSKFGNSYEAGLWRVGRKAEILAFRRGHRVEAPERIGYGRIPF